MASASWLCLLLAMAWSPQECRAADAHEEPTLQTRQDLTLTELLELTVQHQPGQLVLKSGMATASAEAEYGRSLIPEAFQLSGFHIGDQMLDNTGFSETELMLSMPLWLPGEKKAQSRMGEAATSLQKSRDLEFRWQVSGLLRQQLWRIALAMRQVEIAQEHEARLQELLEQVTLFTQVGDLARADQLATLQQLAEAKAETILREADLEDAGRDYIAFTGGDLLPADISELLSPTQHIEQTHPALQRAMDRLTQVNAATEVQRQSNQVRPALQVFYRNFPTDDQLPDTNALGLGFYMPLGKSPRKAPEMARANEELARTEADLMELRRQLDLQLHEARHVFETNEKQLSNSEMMMETAKERHALDALAYELGEFSTTEWLRRLSEYREIERSHEVLLLENGAAIAAYNLAVGETL